LEDRFALRNEKLVKANQPISFFINNSILNPFHLIDTTLNDFAKILLNELEQVNNKIEKLEKEK
jgi:hypothetical protein